MGATSATPSSFTSTRQPAKRGRPKGRLNTSTEQVRAIAQRLVKDRIYQASLLQRLRTGQCGSLEVTLWYYAFGKPKETVEVVPNLSELSDEELSILEALVSRLTKSST